eukprot:COSAG04_NODE_26273_length_297_cov_0.717172_1_plen_75_part_01
MISTQASIYSLLIFSLAFLPGRADDSVGPYLGAITKTEAHLLYSPGKEVAQLRLTISDDKGIVVANIGGKSESEH